MYTKDELMAAYRKWQKTQGRVDEERLKAWDNYVDHRDALPLGATTSQRLKRDRTPDRPALYNPDTDLN